ncbi:MAG: GGDEF domain-containing protein [Spirochaetales bacterium]|nr:GGDEF domain-containing protein [Spirochaetales bacterium]
MTKNIFIIKNKLSKYTAILDGYKKESLFNTHIITYSQFKGDTYQTYLQDYSQSDIVIMMHAAFYKPIEEEFAQMTKKLFGPGFKNVMYLYTRPDLIKEMDIISGSKHCYYISETFPPEPQIINLILYTIKVFNETTLSFRLFDYITNSFEGIVNEELLKKKKEEVEQLNKELETMNKIDSLTKLYNRKTIFEELDSELLRTRRDLWRIEKTLKASGRVNIHTFNGKFDFEPIGELLDHYGIFSVMMLDVDHFKLINDTHGHLIGDAVLRTIGELLSDPEVFRNNDISGRVGGEEFIVVLPETNVNNAIGPAIRFMNKLAATEFTGKNRIKFKISVSIGISESSPKDRTKEDIIKRADKALYWAKEHGRNQIVIYEKVFNK